MVKAGDALHNPVAKETFVILKTAADTGGQLFQMDVTVAAGQGTKIPPHVHPVHEMRLVIKAGQQKSGFVEGTNEASHSPAGLDVGE